MPETPANQSGGVTIGGDAKVDGDFVARDKIIQNIINVGRVLDFASIEGLLPKTTQTIDYNSISQALNSAFSGPSGSSLAESTAHAGEILKDIFGSYEPENPAAALPFRNLLIEIAPKLVRSLQELNYWENYAEPLYVKVQQNSLLPSGKHGEVIWLNALYGLRRKYRLDDKLYGIAEIEAPIKGLFRKEKHINALRSNKGYETFGTFVVKRGTFVEMTHDPIKEVIPYKSDFGRMENYEFRLFIVGLVIDTIGFVSNSSQDVNLWKGLTDMLAPDGS